MAEGAISVPAPSPSASPALPREPTSLPRHVSRRTRGSSFHTTLLDRSGSDISRIGFISSPYRNSYTPASRNPTYEALLGTDARWRRNNTVRNYWTHFRNVLMHPFFFVSALMLLAAFIVFHLDLLHAFKGLTASDSEWVQLLPRIQSLEERVERTSKALQVQVDILGLKNTELGEAHASFVEKSREATEAQANDIQELRKKVVQFDSKLEKMLNENGRVIEQHVLEMIQDILDQRARESSGKLLGLDDVRIAAKRIVDEELSKYAADGIGRPDFALESAGGQVIAHSEPFVPKPSKGNVQIFSSLLQASSLIGNKNIHPKALNVIRPHLGAPGNCLPLKGNNGTIDITLRTSIYPDSITIDHVDRRVAFDSSSAPKDFQVFGSFLNSKMMKLVQKSLADAPELDFLGEFHFDIDSASVQTFQLDKSFTLKPVNYIRLKLLSNYGNPYFTCIYRLRVHGHDQVHTISSSN